MKAVFITGTDTGVGKTFVSCKLLEQWHHDGYQTFGIKPIASGCELNSEGRLVNEDALQLQQSASIKRPYEVVNPIALPEPIAPHLAARKNDIELNSEIVCETIRSAIQADADINLIEGAGGWTIPLSAQDTYADVVVELGLPVILVVGIRLGCINHALLTVKDLARRNVPLLGWVANRIDPEMLVAEENIETLKHWIAAPCLGVVEYQG